MLVLSLFPGIGLLDRAFEEEGFCIVRGPDLLWGGDIKTFHPPAGKFDGVIGGPPCQAFSALQAVLEAQRQKGCAYKRAENLIPEFERVVSEVQPTWFLMENVKGAPLPIVPGYKVDSALYNYRWIGGEQNRLHRFSLGTRDGRSLSAHLEFAALDNPDWSPRLLASGSGNGPKKYRTRDGRLISKKNQLPPNMRSRKLFLEGCRLQGIEPTWDLPGFTVKAKIGALGNAVPLRMGRAVAQAVKRTVGP